MANWNIQATNVAWKQLVSLSLRLTSDLRPEARPGLVYMYFGPSSEQPKRLAELNGKSLLPGAMFNNEAAQPGAAHVIGPDNFNGGWYGFEPHQVDVLQWTSGTSGAKIRAEKKENSWQVTYLPPATTGYISMYQEWYMEIILGQKAEEPASPAGTPDFAEGRTWRDEVRGV